MAARSGAEYVESLREAPPRVYLGGRRVADVTAEPIFQEPIRAIAEQYDMQLDPAYRDVMTYPSPTTGQPVSTSFLVPYTREDLVKKRKHFKLRADHNFGFMGRGPDFMNQFVTGWHLMADRFARAGARFGENATRYYEHVREQDLFLTHMLINPQIDRSKTSAQQEEPFLHLGRVRETPERHRRARGQDARHDGADHRGGGGDPVRRRAARATTPTRSPSRIPTATPGLTFICRETVAPLPRSRFDHPLSSRFEEMDCIAVFEDVLVPWDRVMVDGSPGSAEIINALGADFGALLNVQTAARMLSQLEFFCGLAMKRGRRHRHHRVPARAGEARRDAEPDGDRARGVLRAEAMAHRMPSGVWVPGGAGLRAFHLQTGKIYSRFVEIVQTLAAGGFFYAPERGRPGEPGAAPVHRPLRARPRRRRPPRSASRCSSSPGTRPARPSPSAWRSTCASTPATRSASPPASTRSTTRRRCSRSVERALGRRDGVPVADLADGPGRARAVPAGRRAAWPARTRRRRCRISARRSPLAGLAYRGLHDLLRGTVHADLVRQVLVDF